MNFRWQQAFDDRQHEIPGVTQQVVGPFCRTATRLSSYDDDASIGKAFLFADLVVVPASGVEFRQDVLSTSVGFGDQKDGFLTCSFAVWRILLIWLSLGKNKLNIVEL